MPRIRLAAAAEIRDDRAKIVDLKYESIGVYRREGRYYAFLDNCTHADAPLGEDCLHDGKLVCPLHGACFDARDGRVLSAPATAPLKMFTVIEEGGELYVDSEEG